MAMISTLATNDAGVIVRLMLTTDSIKALCGHHHTPTVYRCFPGGAKFNMSNRKCLYLRRRSFNEFAEILDIIDASTVPIEELRISECSWKFDNRGLWSKCLRKKIGREHECPYSCPVSAPPSSLEVAEIDIELSGSASPLSLAIWLAHSRTLTLKIKWSFQFSLFDESCQKTAQVLEVLGPRLTVMSLHVDVSRKWDSNFHNLKFPDLSRNTGLKRFTLAYAVPDVCPPNYLEMVISKITSDELESLTIKFYISEKEEMSLDYFDFKALGRVLCPNGFQKFPQLRVLTFCLSTTKPRMSRITLDATDLRRRLFKEMPFLKAWQDGFGMQVETLTYYIPV
ncbi:hypothetical protein BDY19DRAFT_994520 [Irpex rosettiformis]|uniref:Uncharacterized protein n=1 Tax=Irpex rosettiformis TaxID=378272 RepID=A0ACB8U1G0_9APHY|nr:hypothetical protein BDY19DRAFT_994520 [Irpex rosettiformis]